MFSSVMPMNTFQVFASRTPRFGKRTSSRRAAVMRAYGNWSWGLGELSGSSQVVPVRQRGNVAAHVEPLDMAADDVLDLDGLLFRDRVVVRDPERTDRVDQHGLGVVLVDRQLEGLQPGRLLWLGLVRERLRHPG